MNLIVNTKNSITEMLLLARVTHTNDDTNIIIDPGYITGKISHMVTRLGNLINDS